MKKGQTEIIGFMVIILLLFFALIFYFMFSSDEGTDFVSEAEQSLEVSNLLNAIKSYSLCDGESLGDAVSECAQGGGFICEQDACELVRSEVPLLISSYGWEEESYMFYIGEELYSSSTCVGNSFADDYTTGGVEVRLIYCYS